jgi:tryptophan synthase beta subunit
MVREFQSVIGREVMRQIRAYERGDPDVLVACVGGGSNSMGLFAPFYGKKNVRMVGVEAAGHGVVTGKHSATLCAGSPGILHGTYTYLLQDKDGQILPTHSISAGLDYPGVGPEHAFYKDTGRASYVGVTDAQALEGFKLLNETEGLSPALESAHAMGHLPKLVRSLPKNRSIVACLSGRGDKDVIQLSKLLGKEKAA